jgi:hypothetical protein
MHCGFCQMEIQTTARTIKETFWIVSFELWGYAHQEIISLLLVAPKFPLETFDGISGFPPSTLSKVRQTRFHIDCFSLELKPHSKRHMGRYQTFPSAHFRRNTRGCE